MNREYSEAWRNDGVTETLWYNPEADIVILAPHGGDIEFGTDDTAARIHKHLRDVEIASTTWMRHGFGEDAFDRFHVSSNKIKSDTFSKLQHISDISYEFAVSLHMHTEDYVAIGGLVLDDIRRKVAEELRNRLPDSKNVVWRHPKMKYEGSKQSNVVNWITEDQASGLQIEMTPVTAYRFRKRVAKAVVKVYSNLM